VNSNVVVPPDATEAPTQVSGDVITQPPESSSASLEADLSGPGAAFANQEIEFTITVRNVADVDALNSVLEVELPSEGSYVESNPEGNVSGNTLSFSLGDLAANAVTEVTFKWLAPDNEVLLTSLATASADNAEAASDDEEVQVGATATVTGGVVSAGVGLRNRVGGTFSITGIPGGASVTRAVLVWALLYQTGQNPSNQITFEGESVTADLTATISQSLCWGDQATIGYATDVTSLVKTNGDYAISDVVNGIVREDSNPNGSFPLTDGASLFVFYGGPGFNDQVISDFTYSASDDNARTLTGITSTGGTATLHLAGPDGQNNAFDELQITGDDTLTFDSTWDGSAPQSGPDFTIGNLWDNDIHDVSSIVPVGQTTLDVFLKKTSDCVGLSAVALQVEQ